MIKVNELRIGNLVLYTQDNDVLPVLKIDGDSKSVCLDLLLGLNMEVGEQDIDPIPLTPEWLERCGFKDQGMYWERKDAPAFVLLKDDQRLYIGNPASTHVHTVHLLQNLIFSLTEGEELQIKNI